MPEKNGTKETCRVACCFYGNIYVTNRLTTFKLLGKGTTFGEKCY